MSLRIKDKGFTLIELAIILVVIGVLIALGAGLVGTLTKQAKYRESKETVKTAREAVIGYAVKNGTLPSTLEDAGAKKLDAWTKDLQYFRATELIGIGDICGVNTTTMNVRECTNTDCSSFNEKSNIAFIIYSTGFDADGACTGNSSPFYVREQNMGYNTPCTYTPTNPQFNYDDIVAYASLDEIRSLRECPQPLTITSPATLPEGVEDLFYTSTLQATGGKPPYTWTGSVGSGLTLNSSGLISGTINVNTLTSTGELTTCSSSVNVTAQVSDSGGSPLQSYTGSIPVRPQPLNIITETIPVAYEGSLYSATISASGGKIPYSWQMSVSPLCPAGLTCSGNSISGTPASGTAGTYTVTSTVSDTCTTNTRIFGLTINPSGGGGGCPGMSLNPPSGTSWSATVGTPFSQSITVSGGQTPYTNTQCTPLSCNGLSLTCNSSGATISGTPTTVGTCTFNVSWQDSCTNPGPQTISGTYTVTSSCAPFTGWSSNLPSATNCQSYTGSIRVVGGQSPYTWSLIGGSLPNGINFCTGNTSTCNLSGTPLAQPGPYSFTVEVRDSCTPPQSTSSGFSISVSDSCYTRGISVRNQSGVRRYYRRNGGTCTGWNHGATITVLPAYTYTIYSDSSCRTQYCPSPGITYCQQKGYDTDGDCLTQMRGGCIFSDR